MHREGKLRRTQIVLSGNLTFPLDPAEIRLGACMLGSASLSMTERLQNEEDTQ